MTNRRVPHNGPVRPNELNAARQISNPETLPSPSRKVQRGRPVIYRGVTVQPSTPDGLPPENRGGFNTAPRRGGTPQQRLSMSRSNPNLVDTSLTSPIHTRRHPLSRAPSPWSNQGPQLVHSPQPYVGNGSPSWIVTSPSPQPRLYVCTPVSFVTDITETQKKHRVELNIAASGSTESFTTPVHHRQYSQPTNQNNNPDFEDLSSFEFLQSPIPARSRQERALSSPNTQSLLTTSASSHLIQSDFCGSQILNPNERPEPSRRGSTSSLDRVHHYSNFDQFPPREGAHDYENSLQDAAEIHLHKILSEVLKVDTSQLPPASKDWIEKQLHQLRAFVDNHYKPKLQQLNQLEKKISDAETRLLRSRTTSVNEKELLSVAREHERLREKLAQVSSNAGSVTSDYLSSPEGGPIYTPSFNPHKWACSKCTCENDQFREYCLTCNNPRIQYIDPRTGYPYPLV